MKFRLYRQHGALNSRPIFDAFEKGVKKLGHEIVDHREDVSVIWSVLWQGRMKENQKIFKEAKKNNKPIVIIEVGNLRRGLTWRISVDHINGHGYFANELDLDHSRPKKLGVHLHPLREKRNKEILIACQHQSSLQWEGMPSMADWCLSTIEKIRKHSDRPIIVRPHPRSLFQLNVSGVIVKKPAKISNSYDDFDIDYGYHCVINHNSGPAVQAAINGVPIICDQSSLAYSLSGNFEKIEEIFLPDRSEWFLKLCHTEWTDSEIASGIPLNRLMPSLEKYLNR